MSTSKLIEQVVQGRGPRETLDALLEELPSVQDIARDVHRELTARGLTCQVHASKREANVVYVLLEERSFAADAVVDIYERSYPELRFLVDVDRG
jgi:hypothetical protein